MKKAKKAPGGVVKTLSPVGKTILKVVTVIQLAFGFTMGLYLFTYGPLFYEKFSQAANPELAITLTAVLFAINNGLCALFEVPTGAIGDAIGRKKTVIWSLIFRALYFVVMGIVALGSSLETLFLTGLISVIIFQLSYTLFSGSFTAWCVDSLSQSDPEVGAEHVLSNAYVYQFVGQIFGGLLGILFYVYSTAHIGFFLAAIVCLSCLFYCKKKMQEDSVYSADLSQLSFNLMAQRMKEIIKVGFKIFRKSRVILMLVMMFASYMFVVNVVDYLWPVYLRSSILSALQTPYWLLMVLLLIGACGLGSRVFKSWIERNRQKTSLSNTSNEALENWFIGTCLLASIPIMVLSWLTYQGFNSFGSFAITILPVFFAYGIIAPCFETLVNNHIPKEHSKERATILSFGSLVRGLMIFILALPSAGHSGETTTMGWIIPAGLLLVTTLVGFYILKRSPKMMRSQVPTLSKGMVNV